MFLTICLALCFMFGMMLVTLTVSQVIPPGICQGRPFGYFVRDVTDCRAYFLCTNAAPRRDYCLPSGTNFDEATQRCVWPEDSNCFKCPPLSPFVDVEVSNHCNQFVRCLDDRPTQMQCGAGLVFDPEAGTCNQAANVLCTANLPLQCPARDNPNNRVFSRNPNDCAQ